jgi:phosphoglycolate phosphatase
MLGDRYHDVTGAIANKVPPVGALWGYGSHAELFGAGCRHFVRSPAEFQRSLVDASDTAIGRGQRSSSAAN